MYLGEQWLRVAAAREVYRELGGDHFPSRHPDARARTLEALGQQVTRDRIAA